MQAAEQVTAASRYNSLVLDRQPFLDRARDAALVTIPSLVPPEGHSGTSKLYTPYQALGARGVNNLASKLLLALLPPSSTFFRYLLDEKVKRELEDGEQDALDHALSQLEQTILREVESRAVRVYAFEMFKHLIVAGNVLMHYSAKAIRVFPISQYVAHRDPEGNLLEIVVKEIVSPLALPDSVREEVQASLKKDERTVEIFTRVVREERRWRVCQEVKGKEIPETEGFYPLDKLPWLALRWTRIDGESYGRGLCEEYIGDLKSLEGLSRAIIEFAAIAAKVVFLVNPNGMTRAEVLADAPNGAVREGHKDDVTVVGLEKFADFQTAKAVLDGLETRLSFAFLLNSAIQRQGERVTAEEIRTMARELEDALGGVYSVFANEFQLPLVTLVTAQLERQGKLPKLPKDTVRPAIVTGLDALGRSHELMRLDAFLDGALTKFGPQVMQYVVMSNYLTRRATGLGIETKGLIRSEEEIARMNEVAQTQQLVEKLGPNAINAGAKLASDASQQGQAEA